MYDTNNVFARILRGELPSTPIYSDEYAYAFQNIEPKAHVHALVIPRGEFVNLADFTGNATPEMVAGFWHAVQCVVDTLGIRDGYRTITNSGEYQSVPHFHVHIMADDKYRQEA